MGYTLPSAAQAPGWLEKDFRELTALFEGRWDNERHGFFAADADLDRARLTPERQHIVIEAQETSIPLTSRFVTRSEAGDVLAHHRFEIDPVRNIILQTSYGGDGETDRDCEIIWHRFAGQFEATGTGLDCITGQDPSKDGSVPFRMALSQTDFWILQTSGDGNRETRFRRARTFVCWTSLLRGAHHGDTGEGREDWMFRSDVTVHDQGGEAIIETDETPPRQIKLLLRDVDWTYGVNRPSLVLYVYQDADDVRAASYAWAEGGADRVGINLRWIQASCTVSNSKSPYVTTVP